MDEIDASRRAGLTLVWHTSHTWHLNPDIESVCVAVGLFFCFCMCRRQTFRHYIKQTINQ